MTCGKKSDDSFIPLSQCSSHSVYLLSSRNLTLGVFDGVDGFVGIRSKFGSRFLDSEYHWDKDSPFGTARPLKLLHVLPSSYLCAVHLPGTLDETTGHHIYFDVDSNPNVWKFKESGEVVPVPRPVALPNPELFCALEGLERSAQKARARELDSQAVANGTKTHSQVNLDNSYAAKVKAKRLPGLGIKDDGIN